MEQVAKHDPQEKERYPDSALLNYLTENKLSANALAIRCGVSPRAIYNLLGKKDKISRSILAKVSLTTGLSVEKLVLDEPKTNIEIDTRTRKMVLDLGNYLFDAHRFNELDKYVLKNEFTCYSPNYEDYPTCAVLLNDLLEIKDGQAGTLTWDQMIAANKKLMDRNVTLYPLLCNPISFKGNNSSSHKTLVIWRLIDTHRHPSHQYEDTIVILRTKNPPLTMGALEVPKLTGWWWINIPKHLSYEAIR